MEAVTQGRKKVEKKKAWRIKYFTRIFAITETARTPLKKIIHASTYNYTYIKEEA